MRPLEYIAPTEPHEVKLFELLEYTEDIELLLPEKDEADLHEFRKFGECCLTYFAQVPTELLPSYTDKELFDIALDIRGALMRVGTKYSKYIRIDGKVYSLPDQYMYDNACLAMYVECDQLEQNSEKSGQNPYFNLPQIMAHLLRLENDDLILTDKEVQKRAEVFKRKANLLQTWQVYNFFQDTKQKIYEKYKDSLYKNPKTDEMRAGIQALQDNYGWFLTIKRLAESGVFTVSGYNAYDSVLRTPVWECFTHLAADSSINVFHQNLYKIQSERNK